MKKLIPKGLLLLGAIFFFSSAPVVAQEVFLMKGVVPRTKENLLIEAGKYKKKGPWRIGMSHFGLSNTWAIQMAHESEFEATSHPNVAKFILRDAGLSASKQFSDVDELVALGVDALIVTPLTPTSANNGINKAIAAGIPVVIHTGTTANESYSVEIQGGGEHFGRVMGEWLVSHLGRKGAIWVLRGVPKHPEDVSRYRGLIDSLRGTEVKVRLGGYGDWTYKGGKALCEELYGLNPSVDGIWSSGADMARACVDVFKSRGVAIPPITGEGNNGFFKVWRDSQLKSIASEYGPEQGAAGVRAAIALLDGKALYKHYVYSPPPINVDRREQFLREDLSDEYWFPSALSEQRRKALYGLKK